MAGYREMRDRKVMAYYGRNLVLEFQLSREGFRKIAMSDDLREATTAVVRDRALPYARQISPYDPSNKSKPHYRDSFVIRQSSITINDLRRVSSRLFNVSDHATLVEFVNTGSHGGPLRRTVSYLIHESVLAEILAGVEANERRAAVARQPRNRQGRFVPVRSADVPETGTTKTADTPLTERRKRRGNPG